MKSSPRSAARGRPPSITRERIADAGIAIGLPNITFVGVAAALGVSHMALYKHVPSLEALKHLVAEEIFSRWRIPLPCDDGRSGLKEYLLAFSASAQQLVKQNLGLTPYVLRRLAATPPMLVKIDEHQSRIARIYGIPKSRRAGCWPRWRSIASRWRTRCIRWRAANHWSRLNARRKRPRWRRNSRRACMR